MTTTTTPEMIPHAARCKRPAPVLRLSWKQTPELWCPGCGRHLDLPIPTDKETGR